MAPPVARAERIPPSMPGGDLSAAFSAIYMLWYRDLLRFFRDKSRIIGSLAQPILFLFVFGAGLSPTMGSLGGDKSDLNYLQFIFPGIISMTILFTAIFGAVSIIWDREFGFLKEMLVAPVPRWSLAVGKALGGSTTSMLQGIIMLIFAPVVGVSINLRVVLELIPLMFILAFALSGMGLFIAARMKSMEGFQLIMNFLMFPLFFLSGALFPLNNIPGWLMVLTRINPATYGVDAIRKVALSAGDLPPEVGAKLGASLFGHSLNPWVDGLIVLAFSAVMIMLAMRSFSVQE
ncbi:ABC transporter permease [Nitrolancea hollandica]|nr:ABC transporter permease [Nitrolancea hollandica]